MARTYKRDQNGRFAGGGGGKPAARGISRGTNRLTRDNSGRITGVGGSGATARGGRLATAKGNQRATQTAKIAGGRSGGTVGKPKGLKPGAIKPKSTAAKPAPVAKPVGKSAGLRFVKQPGGRATAELSGGNRINIAQQGPGSFRASLVGKSGAPKMERYGFRNISDAKKWAANPNARGPRLMGGGLKTEASPTATWRRAPRIASTVAKPKGLKPQSARSLRTGIAVNRQRSINARIGNGPDTAAAKKAGGRITPEKVSRVTGRVNAVTANASSKSGVKRLNATEVGVRAKAFLTRKAGGMSGMVGKTYAQQQAAVAAGMKKPTRYSTQTPNRNKPRAYNELGQANIRRKNQAAANIERNSSATSGRAGNAGGPATATNIRAKAQRLTNIAAANAPTAKALKTRDMGPKAPDTARSRNNRLQTANRRVKYFQGETDSPNYQKAVGARAKALAARPAGTGGKVVFRGKNKAANRQNIRANDLTRRVRYDLQNARPGAFSATAGGGRSGIRRTDTGNRQLSLLGGASKKLYSSRRVAIQRASGKRRYGKR